MWSLGVEEQFYLLFPPLLILLARYPRIKPAAALGVLALVSFAYVVIAHPISAKNAFFMPMARFWELALGCGVAMAEARGYLNPKRGKTLAAIGLLGIVASVSLFDDSTMSSWLLALPTLSTALVIAFGANGQSPVLRLLAARPIVAVGFLSYSLYLVHWPLIVYWRMYTGRPLLPLEQVILFVLMLALAILLWWLVERPMRSGTSRIANRPALVAIAAAVLAATATGVVGYTQASAGWRLNADARASVAQLDAALALKPQCVTDTAWIPDRPRRSVVCRWNPHARGTDLVIWGDSHAGAFAAELAQLLLSPTSSGVLVSLPNCPPLQGIDVRNRHIVRNCQVFVDSVIAAIQRDRPKTIVVGGRWANFASDVRAPGDGEQSGQIVESATGQPISLADALVQTLDLLDRHASARSSDWAGA